MPVTIRSRLLLLVLAVLLPGMLGVAWIISSTYDAERDAYQRNLRDTARAMSMLVDGELSRRATIARVLSQSTALDGAGLQDPQQRLGFERLARRAMQGLDGWVELRARGQVLLSTRLPEGTAGAAAGPAALSPAAAMQPLAVAADGKDTHAAWVEPVLRNGELVYNIAVTVRPSELQRIVHAQRHAGWIGTVVDNGGRVVAREPGGAGFIGRQSTADLRAMMARAAEGAFESVSLDGQATAGYYSTSPLGWTYVSAMPRDVFAGRLPREVVRVAIGALALLLLAVAGAIWVARRIEQPIRELKTAAQDLHAGRPVHERDTGMVECDDVAGALVTAGRTMANARGELEQSVEQAVQRTRLVEQRAAQSQRVEALGRLTGGVAHEFNNLLGIISNSMHLLQRHPAGTELQAPVGATLRAVDKGSQLTQHLLRFSGRRPVHMQMLSFARYLPDVQDLMRSVLGRRIQIQVQVAPNVWPVRVDQSELDLALVNLALNAHDAMPKGGELRVRASNAGPEDKEGLDHLPEGDYVLLTVSDDGIGMDPAQVEHAFEPFFTTKDVGQGSGLGLSQVHGFATQAGGAAWLASTQGLGTTVSLLLPVARDDQRHAAPAPADAAPRSIAGAAVLLVEDDEALGDVTAALLMAHGAKVMRAAHVDAALRLLEAGGNPDIVLSDIVMPGAMDGVALARWLREQRPELPVVLISGYNNTAMAEGEFTVLRKPCAPAELLATLQGALGAHRGAVRATTPPLAGPRP